MHAYRSLSGDTIVAPATPNGVGAIAVIRVSGPDCFGIVHQIFKGKNPKEVPSHTIHFGTIQDGEEILDEVLISVFRAPSSFTKEDSVEISSHGSPYIVDRIVQLLIASGARVASPGEFTQRAFLNGRFDLAQAEAVADLIASDSQAALQSALKQMRTGFSTDLKQLREQFLQFASLLELELDFSEEDVAFADRSSLQTLCTNAIHFLDKLIQSFSFGNAIKNGVSVVIVGKPNAGKSTLLNALLNEDRAIVSEIAGTTRDLIEEVMVVDGIRFRFTDTAGLRTTTDTIEAIGVARTYKKMQEAAIILLLVDASDLTEQQLSAEVTAVAAYEIPFITVLNKVDKKTDSVFYNLPEVVSIAALHKTGLDVLKQKLVSMVKSDHFSGDQSVITNLRHYEELVLSKTALEEVMNGIQIEKSSDLLAEHLREALYHLGTITGHITSDEILGSIFSKFCIGK